MQEFGLRHCIQIVTPYYRMDILVMKTAQDRSHWSFMRNLKNVILTCMKKSLNNDDVTKDSRKWSVIQYCSSTTYNNKHLKTTHLPIEGGMDKETVISRLPREGSIPDCLIHSVTLEGICHNVGRPCPADEGGCPQIPGHKNLDFQMEQHIHKGKAMASTSTT